MLGPLPRAELELVRKQPDVATFVAREEALNRRWGPALTRTGESGVCHAPVRLFCLDPLLSQVVATGVLFLYRSSLELSDLEWKVPGFGVCKCLEKPPWISHCCIDYRGLGFIGFTGFRACRDAGKHNALPALLHVLERMKRLRLLFAAPNTSSPKDIFFENYTNIPDQSGKGWSRSQPNLE